MTESHESQYYCIGMKCRKGKSVVLFPTEDSGKIEYSWFKELDSTRGPIFYNMDDMQYGEKHLKHFRNRAAADIFGAVHIDTTAGEIIIAAPVYEQLRFLGIAHLQFYPVVLISPSGEYLEGYYLCHFTQKIDVIDFAKTNAVKREDIFRIRGDFTFDADKLAAIDLHQRLMFVPKKAYCTPRIIHQQVVDIFRQYPIDNHLGFYPLTDYYSLIEIDQAWDEDKAVKENIM